MYQNDYYAAASLLGLSSHTSHQQVTWEVFREIPTSRSGLGPGYAEAGRHTSNEGKQEVPQPQRCLLHLSESVVFAICLMFPQHWFHRPIDPKSRQEVESGGLHGCYFFFPNRFQFMYHPTHERLWVLSRMSWMYGLPESATALANQGKCLEGNPFPGVFFFQIAASCIWFTQIQFSDVGEEILDTDFPTFYTEVQGLVGRCIHLSHRNPPGSCGKMPPLFTRPLGHSWTEVWWFTIQECCEARNMVSGNSYSPAVLTLAGP